MKINHINIGIFLVLLSSTLLSSTCRWEASLNKQNVYTEEAIYLKYSCQFKDRAELYSIGFNPVTDNENYTIKLLSESERVIESKRINSYEFIAFIHKAGEHIFSFETIMKKTNKESIENTVIGRDNEEYEEFTTVYMKQKKLYVDVKDSDNKLVGELNLEVKKDSSKIKAYTPYHIEIVLEGILDFNALNPIIFDIEGVKVFSQKPIQKIKLTKDGYKGRWSQKFAFSSEHNFTIPSFSINYFNLKEKHTKELIFNKIAVEVTKGFKKEELLDGDEKENKVVDYSFIYYILTFIFGFLVAKIDFKPYFTKLKPHKNLNSFEIKVANAKTVKELVFLLALEDEQKYSELILKIEKGEVRGLRELKEKLT